MRIPSSTTSSENLILLGQYHLAALDQRPETQPLAAVFKTAQDDLITAAKACADAEFALTTPRVALRFAEWSVEQALRSLALAAHVVDNQSTSGPAFKAVFPNGLNAEIRPRGAAQVDAARRVRERLDNQPAAKALRNEHGEKIDAANRALAGCIEARRMAGDALGLARAREDGAKETWIAAYDSSAGALRQMFPKLRTQQDIFFDRISSGRTSAATADDEGDEAPVQESTTEQ